MFTTHEFTRSSLKGCQIVAGGRSEAQTTGRQAKEFSNLKGCPENRGTPRWVQMNYSLLSGGLRYAATTGYYLAAFQAEIREATYRVRSRVVYKLHHE